MPVRGFYTLAPMSHATWAGLDVVESLVGALEDVAGMADDAGRTQLVELVDRALRAEDPQARLDPQRARTRRVDLIAIVTAVLNRPRALLTLSQAVSLMAPGQEQTNVFVALCEEVARREPLWLPEAARLSLLEELAGLTPTRDIAALVAQATAPIPTYITTRTLRGAVVQLERCSPVRLFRFLELVAASAKEAEATAGLRRWVDDHYRLVPEASRAELVALRERLVNESTLPNDRPPRLEIRIEPVGEDKFSVSAWLSLAGEIAPNCGPEDVVTRLELKAWLGRLLDRYAETVLAPDRRARIDFILPASHLNEPVDGWELAYGGEVRRLGAQYRVAVRPDRRSAGGFQRLTRRWMVTSRAIATEHVAGDVAQWLASTSPTDLLEAAARLEEGDWAWLAIICPLMAMAVESVEAVVDTGTPVAIWLRGNRGADVRRRTLSDVCAARLVDDLPDAVWRFRKRGWDGPADDARRDLVLLWDDPTRPRSDELTLVPPLLQGVSTR